MREQIFSNPSFSNMHAIITTAVAKAYACHPSIVHLNIQISLAFDACLDHLISKSNQLQEKSINPEGWIYRVSYNKCRDIQKSKKYEVYLEDKQAEYEEEGLITLTLEHENKLDAIIDALENLNDMSKKVVTLRFVNDCNYEEISRQTGLSMSSIGQTLFRGKKSIRKEVYTNQQLAA